MSDKLKAGDKVLVHQEGEVFQDDGGETIDVLIGRFEKFRTVWRVPRAALTAQAAPAKEQS